MAKEIDTLRTEVLDLKLSARKQLLEYRRLRRDYIVLRLALNHIATDSTEPAIKTRVLAALSNTRKIGDV